MELSRGAHLAYCTNIHRGEDWAQTFGALREYTLAVRDRVCLGRPYAIGLRLSAQAARELSDGATLLQFRRWLDANGCYVVSLNGFPYGKFHGTRVKEQVYAPDWRSRERLEYTRQLFAILAELLPAQCEGSVSTVPCSFKEFIASPAEEEAMRTRLWECVEYLADLSERSGKMLHLGLEPEPLGYLENTPETVAFFERMTADRPGDERLRRHLGINYDTCHLAIEYEEPAEALTRLVEHGIRLSKIHLSSALKVAPTAMGRAALAAFAEDTYLHQVVERGPDGRLVHYRDLEVALRRAAGKPPPEASEWRVHFHIPLHSRPSGEFGNTSEHISGVLEFLRNKPGLCSHLEMETYTWEVMPAGLKNRSVVEQLASEYEWTLAELSKYGQR